MPIEILCKGCSRKLRVGDEHAGKHARCPECGEINPIVAAGSAAPFDSPPAGPTGATSPFGGGASAPTFGANAPGGGGAMGGQPLGGAPFGGTAAPASAFGGAPSPAGSSSSWTPPGSSTMGGSKAGGPNPFADRQPAGAGNPYAAPGAAFSHQEPHRGALILVFGILGFMFCFIFSIMAWVMGAEDLRKIDRGVMDPSGRGLTQAGMIIGIIHCALAALGLVMFFLLMILGAVAG